MSLDYYLRETWPTLTTHRQARATRQTRKFFKQVVQYYLETQLPPGCRAAAIPWYRSKFAQRWRVRIHQALQAGNSQIKRFHLQHWSGTGACSYSLVDGVQAFYFRGELDFSLPAR